MKPSIHKLPRWAQEHIALLEMRLEESKRATDLAHARATTYQRVLVPDGMSDGRALSDDAEVCFRLVSGTTGRFHGTVSAKLLQFGSELVLRVSAQDSMYNFYVSPVAGNVFHVHLIERK